MLVKAHNTSDKGNVSDQHYRYTKINSTKSPASGAGNVSQPNLMSQVGTVRVDWRVSVVRAVEVPVFVGLGSSCSHVTETKGRKACDTLAEGCHPI
jgi:galactokinase/mevalonate kinase-like predicted kinase